MSGHANTKMTCTLPGEIARLDTDEGSTIAVPHFAQAMSMMREVQMNYARLHSIPFWEVGVKTSMLSRTSFLFEAYRIGTQPRGDDT